MSKTQIVKKFYEHVKSGVIIANLHCFMRIKYIWYTTNRYIVIQSNEF